MIRVVCLCANCQLISIAVQAFSLFHLQSTRVEKFCCYSPVVIHHSKTEPSLTSKSLVFVWVAKRGLTPESHHTECNFTCNRVPVQAICMKISSDMGWWSSRIVHHEPAVWTIAHGACFTACLSISILQSEQPKTICKVFPLLCTLSMHLAEYSTKNSQFSISNNLHKNGKSLTALQLQGCRKKRFHKRRRTREQEMFL